jgi:glutaredoxin
MEKAWLDKERIEHEVIYVDSNQEKAMEMVKKTGQMGVPVTEIKFEDGREAFVIGFDKPTLEYYLKS